MTFSKYDIVSLSIGKMTKVEHVLIAFYFEQNKKKQITEKVPFLLEIYKIYYYLL